MFTIDPYYNIERYNQSIEALKNNNIKFQEYISTKPPYYWYIECDDTPILMNYDTITKENKKNIVSKVKPTKIEDLYKIARKESTQGSNIYHHIMNDAMTEATNSDYACFFKSISKEWCKQVSKEYPLKIWNLGKYKGGSLRVCLATHQSIEAFVDSSDILMTKTQINKNLFKDIGSIEREFNYKILLCKEYLIKYTRTPYFYDGRYNIPKNFLEN